MFLLAISTVASAQKMTIKTGSGQQVEISCEGGLAPKEIAVAPDGTVTFKMEGTSSEALPATEQFAETDSDSVDTFVEVDSLDVVTPNLYSPRERVDTLMTDSLVSESIGGNGIGFLAEAVAGEISPEYAQFTKEHAGTHPGTEEALVKGLAKKIIGEDYVETADFLGTLFGSLRFTKDSTFVPIYEQRKPKPNWRTFDMIELSGSLGKNISGVSDAVVDKISEDDYGDDTENHNKYGGGIKYSRVYMKGKVIDGKWVPNPIGFAWSWGGLFDYSYEKEIGSYVSAMGKVGIQIGHDICIGIDALMGAGVTPYNTFITNEINYNIVNKSAWCFKYGVQLWGSLNFSGDTYTAIYGRYIHSVKPSNGHYELSKGWDVVCEDFDPTGWTVGLAIGYKFGSPAPLSQDKRLQANLSTGYSFSGNKGMLVSYEINRLTQVSRSTSLSYGLTVDNVFTKKEKGGNMTSIMLSAGFQVRQPYNSWFWGTKLLAGVGEYPVVNSGTTDDDYTIKDFSSKLCAKGALQFITGFKIGKCSTVSCTVRAGYHIGKSMTFENFDDRQTSVENIKGFDLGAALGYSFTF